MAHRTRIMWIELKDELAGPVRIGRVTYSKTGQSLSYKGQTFKSLKGRGFKSNFLKVGTGQEYWISGCRQDGMDALYSTMVTVDADVMEEYWLEIRKRPDLKHLHRFKAVGKYAG